MLEIKNLSSGYDGQTICKNISVKSLRPELIALIGPNGSGKSTLLKSIDNLIKPESGTVLLDGTDVLNINAKERAKKIAYLSQIKTMPDISVRRLCIHGRFPHMSYPRHYSSEDYSVVNESLRLTGAIDYADKLLSELSGGQQQMAFISMALAQKTDVVLLDEPLTFLDINHQIEILKLMKLLVSMGKTVIAVLHEITSAMKYADRIIVMNDGSVVSDDTPDGTFENKVIDSVFGTGLTRIFHDNSYHYIFE